MNDITNYYITGSSADGENDDADVRREDGDDDGGGVGGGADADGGDAGDDDGFVYEIHNQYRCLPIR